MKTKIYAALAATAVLALPAYHRLSSEPSLGRSHDRDARPQPGLRPLALLHGGARHHLSG